MRKVLEMYNKIPLEAKASFWFLVCAFFQRGISVICTPIFTRLMTTSEYGKFSVFYSWYGIISIFVTLNIFFGVYTRGLVVYEKERKSFSSSLQGLLLVLVVAWLVIYLAFRAYFNNIFSLSTLQMLSMFFVIWANGVYSFWAADQRVDLRYKRLVIMSLSVALLMPVVQILLILLMDDKVLARILGMVVVELVFYPVLFVSQMKKGKTFFSAKYWNYALTFNIPLIPHYLSQTILNSADRLMINQMIGPNEAGIYSLAYSISQIMTVFNTALMQTIEPWLYKKIKDGETHRISKVAYPVFSMVACINIVLIAFAPEIVAFFAPEEYYNAIWVIPPVAMSVFFMFIYTFFAVYEFYYQKTKYITLATLIGAVVNVILNYFFIKLYGYYAAGYTTLICYILYAMFHYFFMKRLIKDKLNGEKIYDGKIIATIILIFLACGFALLIFYNMIILRYFFIICMTFLSVLNRRKILEIVSRIYALKKEKNEL